MQIPLHFEPLPGETGAPARYLARGRGCALVLGPGELFFTPDDPQLAAPRPLSLYWRGADSRAQLSGRRERQGKSNYYLGGNPEAWRTGVPHYAEVACSGLYPGIDLRYYGSEGELEFDLIVAAGADPRAIRLQVEGGQPGLDEEGRLLLAGAGSSFILKPPLAFQEIGGCRKSVPAAYTLYAGNQVSFAIGTYDPDHALVIDPVLAYATYLGGGKSDLAYGIAVDREGCTYITGSTTSADFPVKNAIQPGLTPGMFNNLSDIFITKLNAAGTEILYSTYLGGRWDDSGTAIAVDGSGRACVTGRTSSNDDPATPAYEGFPLQNALQSKIGDPNASDAFVAVLDAFGGLHYSTYLGGKYEDYGTDIAVDASGCLYVTGTEFSFDFPVKNGYLDKKPGYYFDAFVTKIDPSRSGAASLLYSTHLGGTADTYSNAITVDGAGCAYVTGKTSAADFPTRSAIQSAYQGKGDIFVAKIDPGRSGDASLIYATFLGDGSSNEGLGIAVDGEGRAIVSGYGPVPATVGAFTSPGSAFLCKLTPRGDALLWCARPYNARKLAMDDAGNIYAASSYLNPGAGAGLIAFHPDGSDTLFTYRLSIIPSDLAVSAAGDILLSGFTDSPSFPTLHPLQPTLAGGVDGVIIKLMGEAKKSLAVTPDPVLFPLTLPGEISRVQVEIAGTGTAPVEVMNIEAEPAALFRLENVPALPLVLDPGEKFTCQVVYAPPAELLKSSAAALSGSGTLTVTSDGEIPLVVVPLRVAGIIVNNAGDASDYDLADGICDSDPEAPGNQCTLRAALENVNYLQEANPVRVYFRLPGNPPHKIEPMSPLPVIDWPLIFDVPAEDAPIILNGARAGEADGVVIHAGNSRVQDLVFEQWRGSALRLAGGEWNIVERCIFRNNGNDPLSPNASISIDASPSNRIRDNVIYDNRYSGILIRGEEAKLNQIEFNFVGINPDSPSHLHEQITGILIFDSPDNIIRSNVVSNNQIGIEVAGASAQPEVTAGNRIETNLIGSDETGLHGHGNLLNGIVIDGAQKTVITENLISWNGSEEDAQSAGVLVTDSASETALILNLIGLDFSGKGEESRSGNLGAGIYLRDGAVKTQVRENFISANRRCGIIIGHYGGAPVHHTAVERNTIGLDLEGEQMYGNQASGIYIGPASYANTIEENTISGNKIHGIELSTSKAFNSIANNLIGVDITGTRAAPNGVSGIHIALSSDFMISGNTISGHPHSQITVRYTSSGGGYIFLNKLGTSITGGNLDWHYYKTQTGLSLLHATVRVEDNLIAYNYRGIACESSLHASFWGNRIHDNYLGIAVTNCSPTLTLNAIYENVRGIEVDGTAEARMHISGNLLHANQGANSAIHLHDAEALISGNSIEDDAGDGIAISGSRSPVIQKNNFSGNQGYAVNHSGSAAVIDARFNWWADPAGPGGAGPGSGDRVSSGVDYAGWRREAADLVVAAERDSFILKIGRQDVGTLYLQNWVRPEDEVAYTVHADRDWVVPAQTRMLRLGSSWGAKEEVQFLVPASEPEGSVCHVEVRAASTFNPAHRDTARFVVVAGSMALQQVALLPDSVTITRGESVQFTARGYNQFSLAMEIQPLWECTGGNISPSGLYTAGGQTGLYTVTVRDAASGISAQARVNIVEATGVASDASRMPLEYQLAQNYPNPFNQSTRIRYALPQPAAVRIEIFDLRGRRIRTLVDRHQAAGEYHLDWDGCDQDGRAAAAGIYFVRIRAAGYTASRKMALVR
ncbi:MAG TPA: right-handed parallel beta-helix repeat-containing protein [bacterium]|nr:right-handed parallel beta-helix repeat-containing protein [bacterium]HPG84640.1 right-handed parallel beta-helix repeat-containing protein [bacterium]